MPSQFLRRRKLQFLHWWHSPVTSRERLNGALIGALGLFWIAGLGRLMLGPSPASLEQLAFWALAGLLCGALLGARFPRLTRCTLLPFSTFGVSPGS